MVLLIPENLNIDALIPMELTGDKKKRLHDRIAYFLHTLITKLTSKKVFDRYIDEGFIYLKTEYLRKVMGNSPENVITILERNGVIEVDSQYLIGRRSRGYKLSATYIGTRFTHVALRSYAVRKSILNLEKESRTQQKKLAAKIPQVVKQHKSKEWGIDLLEAERWIDTFLQEFEKSLLSSPLSGKSQTELLNIYKEYYQYIRYRLQFIKEGKIDYSIDERSGRLHSTVTNLPRLLRYFLKHRTGSELFSIDIKNSQPFLLAYTSTRLFWSTSTSSKDKTIKLMTIDKELHNKIMKEEKGKRKGVITMINSHEIPSIQEFEELNYKSLVESGELYEYLQKKLNGLFITKRGVDRFGTRSQVKVEVLRFMFFDPRKSVAEIYAPYRNFSEMFPVETQVMNLLKIFNYKDLPILLQRIESELILRRIGNRLQHVPFLTVHDSLIVRKQDVDQVVEIINQEYTEALNMTPRLDIKLLNPSKAFDELHDYVGEKLLKNQAA